MTWKSGGLVPVLVRARSVGFTYPNESYSHEDRHKAPAQPPHIPLSLQDGGGVGYVPRFGRHNSSGGGDDSGDSPIRTSKVTRKNVLLTDLDYKCSSEMYSP